MDQQELDKLGPTARQRLRELWEQQCRDDDAAGRAREPLPSVNRTDKRDFKRNHTLKDWKKASGCMAQQAVWCAYGAIVEQDTVQQPSRRSQSSAPPGRGGAASRVHR